MHILHISKDEAIEILISVIAIALAFSLASADVGNAFRYPKEFLVLVLISTVTIGAGFVLHELAHKLAALYYGAQARFSMWVKGLAFMLLASLFGFLFAAPGAVYIYSRSISRTQNGIISLLGPLTNVIVAGIFGMLAILFPKTLSFPFLANIFTFSNVLNIWIYGAQLNLILALFNLIPAFPLDGSKVFSWSKAVWFLTILVIIIFGLFSRLLSVKLIISWFFLLVLAMILSGIAFGWLRGRK